MSIFNETILPQILDIPKTYIKAFNDDLKAARACLDKFKEEFKNGAKAREKAPQDKNVLTTLQIINEDEDEKQTNKPKTSNEHNSTEGSSEKRGSKKRSKNEVDGILSPEQDKRQKRNASVKAQSIISKQVNVNLTQKLRRENSIEKARNRQDNDDDKENTQQIPAVRIKQEKISLPPEPEKMETVSLPLNIDVKQEPNRDGLAMPPPPAPVRKTRKGAKKQTEDKSDEESQMGARSKKQSEIVPVQRTTRSSSRTTKQLENEEPVIPETRPKRTRAKKATPNASIETTQDTTIASPADKRPKRTRRRRKSSDNQKEQPEEVEQPPEIISPKEERISQPEQNTSSPILPITIKTKNKKNLTITEKSVLENGIGEQHTIEAEKAESTRIDADPVFNEAQKNVTLDLETDNENGRNNKGQRNKEEKRDLSNLNATVTISNEVDKTIVIPDADAAYDQRDLPKANMINETVVLDSRASDTISSNKTHVILDATVVIERAPMATNITEDNSLLTDDDSIEVKTPPKKPPQVQPTSAVKEKVQQFEELASRVTRTKTRALTKKDDANENQTPPDKVIKPALAPDTLTKMNNLIFNGKMPQVIQSASKITVSSQMKSFIPTSTSKLSGINKAREAAEESKKEKEDARRKKEALLEAKREMHRRKREEKMAAAAAAREAAERERRAALVAAAKEKHEKQLHADVTKLERQKEIERKRQELARKVAETEERRRAEENARQQRLEEEQKKKAEDRRKQLEEADAMKKEAALMEREIERKKREFQEKHKMKQRMEGEKIGTPLKYRMEPVYMEGGFQFLNSDEEASPVRRPEPAWSTSKNRLHMACLQDRLKTSQVDKLFSVREQTADLREIFPTIDRARLKRTSSAVWRTPPSRLAALPE
ncbi:unnamed protein product [Leptosia nina]|uniref:Inner centromere protein n=1 Tax=Leptosia nina TaxID=320188 RepID=A0AAV1JHW1_9NEOP